MILVSGGAGFIGANFVLDWLASPSAEGIVNLDKLTYAGNRANLQSLQNDSRHVFVHGDIGDQNLVTKLLVQYQPRAIINFAAESHVDRSIHGPADFIATNIVRFTQTPFSKYASNCRAMIPDIQPIAHLLAIAING